MNRVERTLFQLGMVALVVMLGCLLETNRAQAEAVAQRAIPPMGQAVPVMPREVEIWFSEAVNPDGTVIEVLKLDGTRVDMGNSAVDPADSTRSRVTVGIHPGMDNGEYVVQWSAVSAVDGVTTNGSYRLIVDPAASPAPLPQIATQQAPVQLPEIDAEGNPVDGDRDSLLYGIVAAVTALSLLGLVLFWFFRRAARGRRWSDRPVDRL